MSQENKTKITDDEVMLLLHYLFQRLEQDKLESSFDAYYYLDDLLHNVAEERGAFDNERFRLTFSIKT